MGVPGHVRANHEPIAALAPADGELRATSCVALVMDDLVSARSADARYHLVTVKVRPRAANAHTGLALLLTIGLLVLPHGPAAPYGTDSGSPSRLKVAFRVVKLADGRKMALWYPTDDAEARFRYFRSFGSAVALGGAPARPGPFPLIVFSHGFGGCGTQSAFFTEELARRGYVVAAPDHKDASCRVDGTSSLRFVKTDELFSRPERWNETTQADRRTDLERAIQWAVGATDLGRVIDRNGIGVAGHSLGGYTALGLAGGWSSWRDSRVKALLLFAPYAAPFVVQQRLRSVHVPVMYQAADRDHLVSASSLGEEGGAYGASPPPKYYVQLRGGSHFEWTNLLCLGRTTVAECLNAKLNARLINAYGIAFLDSYLKGQTEALERLTGSGLDDYKHVSR
jgi:predicted dienelactone hydrolase